MYHHRKAAIVVALLTLRYCVDTPYCHLLSIYTPCEFGSWFDTSRPLRLHLRRKSMPLSPPTANAEFILAFPITLSNATTDCLRAARYLTGRPVHLPLSRRTPPLQSESEVRGESRARPTKSPSASPIFSHYSLPLMHLCSISPESILSSLQ